MSYFVDRLIFDVGKTDDSVLRCCLCCASLFQVAQWNVSTIGGTISGVVRHVMALS